MENPGKKKGRVSHMIVRYKAVVAGCAALLSGVALAHFPISVSPESDDGLFGVGWTPIQVGICSHRPFQLFPGDADGCVQIGLLNAVINGDGGDYGDCSASLQIGLINYNPHGIAKWLPIINFSRGRKD